MATKRLHFSTSLAQYRELEEYAEELGMDITNAIRHCIAVTLERRRERKRQRDEQKRENEG